ncbi:low-density lipoprotein receptor-related protein 4 isoform X2, partial [Biomphalaria glabrata]
MAFDWIAEKIYWTDYTYNFIKSAKKNEPYYQNTILKELEKPFGIAVHPGR